MDLGGGHLCASDLDSCQSLASAGKEGRACGRKEHQKGRIVGGLRKLICVTTAESLCNQSHPCSIAFNGSPLPQDKVLKAQPEPSLQSQAGLLLYPFTCFLQCFLLRISKTVFFFFFLMLFSISYICVVVYMSIFQYAHIYTHTLTHHIYIGYIKPNFSFRIILDLKIFNVYFRDRVHSAHGGGAERQGVRGPEAALL